jgi:serine/threonine protein kinase
MAVANLFEDLLDQYKLEQRIAEKRYTDLFQAYDVDDDRLVWLEILRAGYAEDSSFGGRFVNRARALAQVRHPNIAQVLHIGKAVGGAPYVAQESIDGYPLSYRLEQLAQRNTPVNPIYALKLVRQLADALLLAERLEIFHYDLQPDNIFLKNVALPMEDTVTLIDLFVPAEKAPRTPTTEEGASTLAYLSPEQRAGREVTAAGHIYSLGAILYRLLAGRTPKGPVTMRDNTVSRLFGRAIGLEQEREDLTPATYELIHRSLQKDPRRRFPNIDSFIIALEAALKAEENRSRAEAVGRPPKDKRWSTWLLPLLALVLLSVIGVVAIQGLRGRTVAAEISAATTEAGSIAGSAATVGAESPSPQLTATSGETTATAVAILGAIETSTPSRIVAAGQDVPATITPSATSTFTPSPSPTANPTGTPTPEPALFVRVVHNMVNLRHGPGVAYPVFDNVTGGESLEVLAWNGDELYPWLLVITDDNRIGWIAATVVQMSGDLALTAIQVAATIPPTPIPIATTTATPAVTPALGTITPTVDADDGLGGVISTAPPDDTPDDPAPTEQPSEPTRTPPP